MIDHTKRLEVANRAMWECQVCGKLLRWNEGQVAHRIARTKWALRKYGEAVIDHVDNLRWTCPEHNATVLITNKPVEREKLVEQIRRKLDGMD